VHVGAGVGRRRSGTVLGMDHERRRQRRQWRREGAGVATLSGSREACQLHDSGGLRRGLAPQSRVSVSLPPPWAAM
jgi:hypothetical protein